MAKTVYVPVSNIPRYMHRDGLTRTYPPAPIVEVGRIDALHSAIDNAAPNSVIEIAWPGTYNLQRTLVVNQPNVTIRAAAGLDPTDVVLVGRGMYDDTLTNGVYSQVPGLTLEGFTLSGFHWHAVTFGAGAHSPTFRRMHMYDCGQQFIKASAFPEAIDSGYVGECVFVYTQGRPVINFAGVGFFYGSPIDVHNGNSWVVEDSVFSEIAPTEDEIAQARAISAGANQNWWAPASYFWNRSSNTIVQRCVYINCGRAVAYGLMQRTAPEHDHSGGIIRNIMCVVTPGRFGAEQIADADAQILAWDSPGTKILHTTVLTGGQCPNSIQGRWSTGLDIGSNLSDVSIRMRDGAAFSGLNNVQAALPSWFVNPTAGNLRLNTLGNANVPLVARLAEATYDIDRVLRPITTKVGAHHYG